MLELITKYKINKKICTNNTITITITITTTILPLILLSLSILFRSSLVYIDKDLYSLLSLSRESFPKL